MSKTRDPEAYRIYPQFVCEITQQKLRATMRISSSLEQRDIDKEGRECKIGGTSYLEFAEKKLLTTVLQLTDISGM
jgi:hypothetical protein